LASYFLGAIKRRKSYSIWYLKESKCITNYSQDLFQYEVFKFLINQTYIIHTMESEADIKTQIIPNPDDVNPFPHLHEDILRQVATFLDFQSLLQFRLVSREWNAIGLPILMKRGYYILSPSSHEIAERNHLHKAASNYSSWKIKRSVYQSSELLQDDQIWQNVKSLIIHQRNPGLSRGFHVWAWETIESRCPNLQELTFNFQSVLNTKIKPEVVSDYELAIQGLPNASFPKISNLPHLSSVHFKGICGRITAYFAQHLLQACSNLRHLSFCPLREPPIFDLQSFRIFEYLQNNPKLLMNLHSFAFNVGSNFTDEYEHERNLKRCEFTKLMTQNPPSLPFQFSHNLQTLFWGSPFHLDDQFLPGVLTPSVASSLLQLCLEGNVRSLEESAESSISYPIKLSFPSFPRLRALKLGRHTASSLSVPELVDSAPNLYVLEMKGAPSGLRNELISSLWRRTDREESDSNTKQHLQLRIFFTDIPATNLTTIGEILWKFPNLEELRLGRFEGVGLEEFLSFLQSSHLKLQRLSWKSGDKFTLEELFRHLIRLPGQLPTLNSYSLGWQGRNLRHCEDVQWPDSIQDMEELANILLSLPSKSDSALVINLLLKSLSCNCMPKEGSPANDCKQCYLQQFIRSHNLPIRIHSVKEIDEAQRKYERNHRFASCWIYK
jgi:hypothetical protein